ncbi:MAG: hypothetical protein WBF48_00455 [Halarcobacter sp.]
MLKNILNKFFIPFFTFLILQNSLLSKEILDKVNLQDIEIPLNKKDKTKEDYEKEENLLNPSVLTYEKLKREEKDDLELDGSLGVNKERRSIDEVKVNIGTKF